MGLLGKIFCLADILVGSESVISQVGVKILGGQVCKGEFQGNCVRWGRWVTMARSEVEKLVV